MLKKKDIKFIKFNKYVNLINHKLKFENKPINRYKVDILSKKTELAKLKDRISKISNCDLKNNAKNIVFADGNSSSKIMLIGEGPGANEDKEGLPFVGRAGQLLDKMLASIKLDRKNVYITNVVNFRPPENRKPTNYEIERYLKYLEKHISIIRPKIIVLLGSTALKALVGDDVVISKARGKWIRKKILNHQVDIIASFHPAFLMRQPDQKKYSWVDLKMIKKRISELNINIV